MIKQGSIITLDSQEKFIVMETIVENNITYLYIVNQEDMLDVDIMQLTNDNKLSSIYDELFKALLIKFNDILNTKI